MVSPRYSELGQTLGVPDVEFTWYWNILIFSFPWLLMGGFVLFPLSIEHEATKIHGSQSAITISSCVLIGLSYLFCIICLVRWRKSDVLQDFILIPFFGSSLTGLFCMMVNVAVRDLYPLDALSITGIALAGVSALTYGAAALYNSKIEKNLPKFLRNRRRFKDRGVDDAELQRRQLLKLYMKSDADRAPSFEMSKSTFRIDIPETIGLDPDQDTVLTPPQQTYERHLVPTTPPLHHHPAFAKQNSLQNLPAATRSPRLSPSKPRQSHQTHEDSQHLAELVP